ncbi:MAG: hypothetical protein F9K16_12590 [Thermoanaerobaculia bacterium]|nr:MAG: hypothetical protein F9K16_12590 [Thermoanaerobaculia bacterium]MBZ0102836.1 hypothetical protein [Thermoanaerobaculia bacterium]
MFSPDWVPFWTALAALAAAASAVVAARYTFLTASLVRLQMQPQVILYVTHDLERTTIFMLVVKNIGHGVARDVKFFPERPIPAHAFGIAEPDKREQKTMTDGPLVEGIPLLAPGESRLITWGQIGGLTKALGGKPLAVNFEYLDGDRKVTGNSLLEVRSYWATDASTRPVEAISRSLDKLAKSAANIESALRK